MLWLYELQYDILYHLEIVLPDVYCGTQKVELILTHNRSLIMTCVVCYITIIIIIIIIGIKVEHPHVNHTAIWYIYIYIGRYSVRLILHHKGYG